MIKKILLVLALIVAAILIAAAFRPGTMEVLRSARVNANPEAVFAVVNDLSRWNEWSPWAKLDPEAEYRLEGPGQGAGATYHWSGNHQVGEGRLHIVESRPGEYVAMQLVFVRPFPGEADVRFDLKPSGEGTEVSWSMRSPQPYLGKLMGLFVDCEKMCGDQFLEGLEGLRRVVEGQPAS